MTDKPRRPWFQFHLLTAVILTLAAGALISINALKTYDVLGGSGSYRCGWPLSWYWTSHSGVNNQLKASIQLDVLLVDIGAALLILLAVAVFSEFLLRRRERRSGMYGWFQLHLSTAVVMMLLGGAFLGANLLVPQWNVPANEKDYWETLHPRIYGWPADIYSYDNEEIVPDADGGYWISGYHDWEPHWRMSGIVFNGVILFVALILTAFVSEYIIRRRTARNPPTPQ